MSSKRTLLGCLALSILALPGIVEAAATIVIVNNDAANVGFNDPTVVAPVGGNSGTTLGQQRLIAFQAAADKWGATLTSSVTIRIRAQWTALNCTATSAVLGSAGATSVYRDFTNAPVSAHWYSKALADKLVGSDLDSTTPDINANFNVNLGNTGCLTGTPFYLGLDNNHGSAVDLVTVLTHEFGHGLGFQTFTSGSTGNYLISYPSIWDMYLYDVTLGKTWDNMTAAQRQASALNTGKLVWTGTNVNTYTAQVLQYGYPQLVVTAPASIAGLYEVGLASAGGSGSVVSSPGVTGEVMPVVDQANGTGLACTALSAVNVAAVAGKIALVDRGTCTFGVKAKNVQNAGAIAVLIADNAAGSPPAGIALNDVTVTIPSVRITLADGNTLKTILAKRTRAHSGLFATLSANMSILQGADSQGRMRMYAPNPFQSGSSVSHYDTVAFPNQLMEPAINADLTHEVTLPYDLTFQLLKDIGWN